LKFIIDAQLPPALARYLETCGHKANHVAEIDMRGAPDRSIWDHAKNSRAVIVTKDEDFALMRIWDPSGPAVI
jgi:predicted nuclease of predicted toxin-antitoxin system